MPAFSISAVNTGTDELTVVAHGLVTGDRFHVRNVGGALPTGLSAATDYFAVRTGADTLKVAASSANAFIPTVIDITGAGSGTNTLEYGLPFCIPTALAAAGTQIKSADANGSWAALVALYNLLVGLTQSVWTAVVLAVDLTMAANKHVTVSGTGLFKHPTVVLEIPAKNGAANGNTLADGSITYSTTPLYIAIPLPVGKHISNIAVTYNRSSGTLTVEVKKIDSAGTVTSTTLFTDASNTGWRTASNAFAATFAAGEFYEVKVTGGAGSISGIAVSNDQP